MTQRATPVELGFTETLLCFFGAYMWSSVLAGILLGLMASIASIVVLPLILVFAASVGASTGIFLTPIITLVWIYLRKLIGESAPVCFLYGALIGGVLSQFSVRALEGTNGFMLGASLGLIGGGIYWWKAEKEKELLREPIPGGEPEANAATFN